MKAITKIILLDHNGDKFFGEGPVCLLHAVESTGSLRAAALSMGMAYTKALRIINQAEQSLGYSLMTRAAGGRSGGGSCLTAEGKAWLKKYEEFYDACVRANQHLYQQYFGQEISRGKIGCVIMASGRGRRFGSNKLLEDFHGQPMICRILQATEGIFDERVVVTRYEEIAALCKEREIPVILHDQPYRSDTVTLGLEALKGVDRCMFCPSDQPLLTHETIKTLVTASAEEPKEIWRAAFGEIQGAPVVFPAWAFSELMTLPEGKGGGVVIKNHPEHIRTVQVQDYYELKDVDKLEDLSELLAR